MVLPGTPEETGKILRYLSTNNGFAPEEAKPVFWEAEHRRFRDQDDGTITPAPFQTTCNTCHQSAGFSVKDELAKITETRQHGNGVISLYRDLAASFRQPTSAGLPRSRAVTHHHRHVASTDVGVGYPEPPKKPAKSSSRRYPSDYLSNQPLITRELNAWKCVLHRPDLSGAWLVNGFEREGPCLRTIDDEPAPIADEFVTKIELHYANTGRVVRRQGKGIVYTGYSWRGRSKLGDSEFYSKDPNYAPPENKEAMLISAMERPWRDAGSGAVTTGSAST